MKYKYSHVSGQHNLDGSALKRPAVWVDISAGKHKRRFIALIDSGADYITMSSRMAEVFGIERGGRQNRPMLGITMEPVDGFVAELTFQIENLQRSFIAPVVFINSPHVPILLGREGFFDRYRIKFEEDHDTFEITPSSK